MGKLIEAENIVKVAEHAYHEWNLGMAAAEGNRQINRCYKMQELCKAVKAVAEAAPAVDAEPVVHAEWQFDSGCGRVRHYRCTRCGRMVCSIGKIPLLEEFPYCHCGAKMDVEKPVESVDK